jgi:hypothetical protein
MSALQGRTIDRFRNLGFVVGSVERRKRFPAKGKFPCRACGNQPMIEISHDLFNVFDLIAIRPKLDGKVAKVLIQTTSASNHANRRMKILTSAEARFCLMAGIRICIESWSKVKNRWQARDEWITLDQFSKTLPRTPAEFHAQAAAEKARAKALKSYGGTAAVPVVHAPIFEEELPF